MKVKYSIIISAYNVERYIDASVRSALAQSSSSGFEVLVVDDCSQDQTSEILSKFNDERLRVLRLKENGGLSNSRNVGIRESVGDWVIFLDGDDLMEPGLLNSLDKRLSEKQNTDLIVYGFKKFMDVTNEVIYQYHVQNTLQNIFTGAWNKAYSRSAIKNLQFPKGLLFEDMAFTAIAYLQSKHVEIVDSPFLMYRQRPASITQSTPTLRHLDVVEVLSPLVKYRDEEKLNRTSRSQINMLINKQLFVHLHEAVSKPHSRADINRLSKFFFEHQEEWKTGRHYDESWLKNLKDIILMQIYKLRFK